jgi:hypothetical protein
MVRIKGEGSYGAPLANDFNFSARSSWIFSRTLGIIDYRPKFTATISTDEFFATTSNTTSTGNETYANVLFSYCQQYLSSSPKILICSIFIWFYHFIFHDIFIDYLFRINQFLYSSINPWNRECRWNFTHIRWIRKDIFQLGIGKLPFIWLMIWLIIVIFKNILKMVHDI